MVLLVEMSSDFFWHLFTSRFKIEEQNKQTLTNLANIDI